MRKRGAGADPEVATWRWRLRCIRRYAQLLSIKGLIVHSISCIVIFPHSRPQQVHCVLPWNPVPCAPSCLQARCRVLDAILSRTRYVKWAGGSRSQTHRRAVMGCFTQDDGYVQDVSPMHSARPPLTLLELLFSSVWTNPNSSL